MALFRLLVVEDDEAERDRLERMLAEDRTETYETEPCASLAAARDLLGSRSFDLLLADLDLPDSEGLSTVVALHEMAPQLPFVALVDADADGLALRAIREGAQDCLVKARIEGVLLERSIRYAIERHRLQEGLRSLSLEDELTGLYNRRGFKVLADQQLKLAHRNARECALLFVDVDGLKEINDHFGHREGDLALLGAAQVLRHTFRGSDLLARLGGDELAVLAVDMTESSVPTLESRLRDALAAYNRANDRQFQLALSIGHAVFKPELPLTLDELLAAADGHLYARRRGAAPEPPSPRVAPPRSAGATPEALRLELYVNGSSASTGRALENLHRVVGELPASRLEVIDVLLSPHRAEERRVLSTPTLVRLAPEPERRILGDLSDLPRVAQTLEVAQGGARRGSGNRRAR